MFLACLTIVFLTFPHQYYARYSQQRANEYGYESREELAIGDVTSDDRFESGRGVFQWESVTIGNENYAVGLMERGITIFAAEIGSNGSVNVRNKTDLSSKKIIDVELLKHWNSSAKSYAVIVVLAVENSTLEWYQITDNLDLMEIWVWDTQKNITHINIFQIETTYHLLILKKQKHFTADIYRITLSKSHSNQFWFTQTLRLRHIAKSSTFTVYQSTSFLSIPQNHNVHIFKYENNSHFKPFTKVESPGVDLVDSFTLESRSYLLLNGANAGIYEFNNQGVTSKRVENTGMDGINFWLPIKLTTYKDEVVLLGQRVLDHGNHKSKKLELILSSAGKFYAHEEIPCRYYGDLLSGIDCLVEEENHNHSINGSSALLFDRALGIVMPRRKAPSGLFLLSIKTRRVPNPIQQQMKDLAALKTKLENMMAKRKESITAIQKQLENYPKEKYIDEEDKRPSFERGKPSTARSSEDQEIFDDMGRKIDGLQQNLNDIKDILRNAVRRDAKTINLKTLVLNDIASVKGESKIKDLEVTQVNDVKADALFKDFVRSGDKNLITGEKTFTEMTVNKLDAATINDVKVSNMVFKNNLENLKLKGTFMIENMVEVLHDVKTTSGKINDEIDLSKALTIDVNNDEDEIIFENIEANAIEANYVNKLQIHNNYIDNVQIDFESDSSKTHDHLYIPGDTNVQYINGENLQDILDSVVTTNEHVVIPGNIVVHGDINVTGNVGVDYLNDNKFPEEYIFRDWESRLDYIEFLGDKHFENLISADEVTARAGINGVDTSTLITLSDSQSIPGLITFTDFNPIEKFDVRGNISGIPDISPHPTIREANVLKSDVSFENLEVEGTLIIGNLVNGTNLEQVLEDVVLKDEDKVIITSIKDFQKGLTIDGDLRLESNTINGVSLSSFVDKTSEQTLNVDILHGNVTFENLQVSGYFGGINITELNAETVKVSGNQFISSTLNFLDELRVSRNFEIEDLLNDVAPDSYVFTTGDRLLPSVNKLGRVQVDTLTVEGDLNGKVDNFDVVYFNENRLSLTKNQTITGKYFIENLDLGDLEADKINNYDFKELMEPEKHKALVVDMILENKIKIRVLDILGNISIQGVNNINMEAILQASIYKGGNQLAQTMSFGDDVEFTKITIENLNSLPFDRFIANLVFKNQTNVTLYDDSVFERGFDVDGFIETEIVNGVAIRDVLRKSGNQKISGPIIIKGNISVADDTSIGGDLNGVSMRYLSEVFEVVDDDTYKITGDVVFEEQTHIDHLFIQHSVNNKNLAKFLNNVIRVNDDAVIPGVTQFSNKVQINTDIGVMNRINGIDLSKFIDDVVLTTYDTYIQGLVTFAHPVKITKGVFVETDLWSETIMGINVKEWLEKAVFINKGFIAGELTFDSVTIMESLNVEFVNSINMSALIPLRTNQYLPEGLYIDEMSINREIIIDNLVNGIRLDLEYSNTLLNDGRQEIFSDIEFTNNVVVYKNFDATGLVNTVNLSQIVTTNTDQNLSATYHFQGPVLMHSNLQISGKVNNINVSDWNVNALKKKSDVQNIDGPMIIKQNLTFINNVAGKGNISGLNLEDVARTVEIRKQFKETQEKQLRDEYGATCDGVNELLHKAKSQGYRFKYFDYFQILEFANDIGTIHHFHHENTHYMLVNEIRSCKSSLFSWSPSGYTLIRKDIDTGIVLQFVTVKDIRNALYLVGRSEPYATTCPIEGTNVWKFENQWEILLFRKMEDLSLIQESKIPGTFYGFTTEFTYEFKIMPHSNFHVRTVRKWVLDSDVRTGNLSFMPQNLGTGLSLRDGHFIFRLLKEGTISDGIQDHNTEEVSVEDTRVEANSFVPGRNDGEFIVFKVGKYRIRTMTAVIEREETTIRGSFDVIKIYEDILSGKIFHKITTYKPSSLVSMDFNRNGETLLIFIEDEKVLQIFEYKGLEGFKLRSSIKMEAQKLFPISLPFPPHNKRRNALAVLNRNKLTLIQSIMEGSFIDEDYLKCSLQ